ncbi:MAG: phosphoribosyl-AMP cyclohydrolase [Deltaproteobacteria bacterium]|nr:phosphoribosyl-AMP cyclohydrolase [Deltaproteobacteria bacterium]
MESLSFDKGDGLIPAIIQDYATSEVLMLAYMNRESWRKTLELGKATFWSRSRQTLWTKGETSGNVQIVKEILIDCDSDTILLKVDQVGGAACHTGYRSCFFRRIVDGAEEVVGRKVFAPEDVYGR